MSKQQLTVVENEQFGEIRTVMIENEPWFVAADVCRVLEIKNPSDTLSRLDEDERTTLVLTDGTSPKGGNPNVNIINEPGLYTLVLGSRKPEAKAFKRWIMHEVIPSIRKTGAYALTLSPAELLVQQAKLLLEQQKRLNAVEEDQKQLAESQRLLNEDQRQIAEDQRQIEEDLKELEAKVATHPENYYTVSGYAKIHGFRVNVNKANILGRMAARLSREYGYDISRTPDPRFGEVNVYHEDILKEVFDRVWAGWIV